VGMDSLSFKYSRNNSRLLPHESTYEGIIPELNLVRPVLGFPIIIGRASIRESIRR